MQIQTQIECQLQIQTRDLHLNNPKSQSANYLIHHLFYRKSYLQFTIDNLFQNSKFRTISLINILYNPHYNIKNQQYYINYYK